VVILLLACSDAPEVTPVAETPVEQAQVEEPPAGRIGGEPILPHPVVLGGISTSDVEAGLAELDTQACHQAFNSGKVLVQFTIDNEGHVTDSKLVSTSLRTPETEACLVEAVRSATFPALVTGDKAIVKAPFLF